MTLSTTLRYKQWINEYENESALDDKFEIIFLLMIPIRFIISLMYNINLRILIFKRSRFQLII